MSLVPAIIENNIFLNIKNFFQSLPPNASDDYENAFSDIIAMYGFGGEEYIIINEEYENIISAQLKTEMNNLSMLQKKEIIQFYENNYLQDFVNDDFEGLDYSDKDFITKMLENFKTWVIDYYSIDDLEEEEIEEEDEVEFNKSRSAEAIAFIQEVTACLINKDCSKIILRRLEVANIFLNHHPLVPDDDYIFYVSFKYNDIYHVIEYSNVSIKIYIYTIEHSEETTKFIDEIDSDGYTESVGLYDEYKSFFLNNLKEKNINKIAIQNFIP